MKSSILNFQVEGFFYLWQNIGRFLCHGIHKTNKKSGFEDKKT